MPLTPGNSKSVISHNIAEMIDAGHAPKVAEAAAFANARRHPKASGGALNELPEIEMALAIAREGPKSAEKMLHKKGIDFHGGMINAPVHGRTDKIPLNVPSGSYVLPADIVSALGQGNSIAGAKVIQEIMKGAPYKADSGAYGSGQMPITKGRGPGFTPGIPQAPSNQMKLGDVNSPEPPHMKKGGKAMVPIIAAGGEYVLGPHEVHWIGDGDIGEGHKRLDEFVKEVRKKHIKTLKELPGPAR